MKTPLSTAAKILAELIAVTGHVTAESVAMKNGATVARARSILAELQDHGIVRRRGRNWHHQSTAPRPRRRVVG